MNPTLEPLARYVTQEVEKGVPESTIRAILLQQGWTDQWVDAAFAAAVPSTPFTRSAQLPRVQPAEALVSQPQSQPQSVSQVQSLPQPVAPQTQAQSQPQFQPLSPVQAMRGGTNEYGQPAAFMSVQPAVLPRPKQPNQEILTMSGPQSRSKMRLKALLIFLLLVAIAAGAYYMLNYFQAARQQKAQRDVTRRNHLSIMLNDLSDYYVAHGVYPTAEQLNNAEFQSKEGFDKTAMRDPQWSSKEAACTKDNASIFAATPAKHCYSYVAATSQGAACNKDVACKKMAISIFPEKDGKPYIVTFDQNSEIGE